MQSQILGAVLGLACGDALGAPAEFQTQDAIKAKWGTLTEMVGSSLWQPGEWTDDTAMMLCVAEGIIARPADPILEVGNRFLAWFQNSPKDVGSTIRAVLSTYQGNWAQAAKSIPQAREGRAAGNGSLMRILPVALAYSDQTVMLRQSARLSAMTHWDPQAETCCAVYCLWISALLGGSSLKAAWTLAIRQGQALAESVRPTEETPGMTPLPLGFWDRLSNSVHLPYEMLQPSGYAGYVVDCLEAAVSCSVHAESLEDALVRAANLAGEADTIAAVAGGAAGAYWGHEAIPSRWLAHLFELPRLQNAAAGISKYLTLGA